MLRQSWAASARWGTRATSCRLARARLLGQGQGHGRERDEDTARRVVYFGRARARPSAGRGAELTYGDDPRGGDREGIGRNTPPSYGKTPAFRVARGRARGDRGVLERIERQRGHRRSGVGRLRPRGKPKDAI